MRYKEKSGVLPDTSQSSLHKNEIVSAQRPPTRIDRKMVWILSVACALTVGNLYYSQPLLADFAQSFRVSESTVGFIATLAQVGYALGLLLIVPLGDAFNRRTLITLTLLAVTASLLGVALAPSVFLLAIASLAVGFTTIAPQIIVPFAASLAAPEERGRIVGIVMSGLLIGILLARTISGFVGAHLGWQAMYWIAAAMMLLTALVLRFMLPEDHPQTTLSYPELMRSLWSLLRREPVVREVSLFGALAFGAFSAFWVTLIFFLGKAPYHYGSDVAGLFGLVGVVGALVASSVGRLTDRINPRRITGIMLFASFLSYLCFWLAGQWLWGLILGVILLDLGTQGAHISNQARVYSLQGEARSRLNTIYMVSYFIGGSLGSMLGAAAWGIAGWNGVCTVGLALLILALAVYVFGMRRSLTP